MRILLATQHFHPEIGGAEVMLRRLAAEWVKGGDEVRVLSCRWDAQWPAEDSLDGFLIHRRAYLRVRGLGTLLYLRDVERWLVRRRAEIDVVYVSMLKHAAFAALRAGARTGIPVVLRAEGAGTSGDVAWQERAFAGARIARSCRRAAAIIAPSEAIRAELLDAGYPAERIHLFSNAVSVPLQPWRGEETSARRASLGLAQKSTLIYTGRLHPDKGLADLIAALPLMKEDACVVLVGSGPAEPALRRLAGSMGLADRVTFAGPLEDVEPFLRAADVFVLPSYEEGLSVSLLEALALGMPTIASAIEANRGVAPTDLLPLFDVRRPSSLASAAASALAGPSRDGARVSARRAIVRARFGLEPLARRHRELFQRLVHFGT